MPRRPRDIKLPAPYLKRIVFDASRVPDMSAYPFCLPMFQRGFELSFDNRTMIIVGENGSGKSTLLEGIAAVIGFNEAGGNLNHGAAVDRSSAIDVSGAPLAQAFRAAWLPKLSKGWFFRAETFFSIARYLDEAAIDQGPPPDFLSHSHGEGFLRFFEERCERQGIYIFDEPESALSPARQIDFLKLLRRMEDSNVCQVIVATHSPILMAYPNARLLRLDKYGLDPVSLEDTNHFRLLREFFADPESFLSAMMDD